MAQSPRPPIFDVLDIEREIEGEFRKLPIGSRIPADRYRVAFRQRAGVGDARLCRAS